jgi:hypothetical protein
VDQPPANFSLRDALTAFSADEVVRLERYNRRATELKDSRFFQTPAKFTMNVVAGRDATFDLARGEDEEQVTTMVTRLRNLHEEGRPGTASFPRTVSLLRGHTKGKSPSARWFRVVLDDRQANVPHVTSRALIGLAREYVDKDGNVIRSEDVPPDEPFLDWMYGYYLHDDEERLARIQSWAPQPIHRFNFLQMASELARIYYGFTGIVKEVLAEPSLLPAAVS